MRSGLLGILFAALLGSAEAQDVGPVVGQEVKVQLANGDSVTGTLVSLTAAEAVLDHPQLGRLSVPRGALQEDPWIPAPPPPPPTPEWKGSLAAGLTGSEGNTDRTNFRFDLNSKYAAEDHEIDVLSFFRYATEDNEATDDKKFLQGRYSWLLPDSRWRPFAQASWETGRFDDYDSRVAAYGGSAYEFHEDETGSWLGRLGLGASKKMGVDDDETFDGVSFEALLGTDYERVIDERQKFVGTLEYYPSINNSPEFRTVARAAYDVKLTETDPWFLRFGAEHRHDSDPGDAQQNDLSYYMQLGYDF